MIQGTINNNKILFASIYLQNTSDVLPTWLRDICLYAQQNNTQLILAGDFNYHSKLWASDDTKTDQNGELLEQLICEFGLNLHNTGFTPTFRNSRNFTSCIDLTLSMNLNLSIEYTIM